jgi:hypothetical protein
MTVQEPNGEPLHKRLIELFNAGARPLSSDALNALLQHFECIEEVSNEQLQDILAELTVGSLSRLETNNQQPPGENVELLLLIMIIVSQSVCTCRREPHCHSRRHSAAAATAAAARLGR